MLKKYSSIIIAAAAVIILVILFIAFNNRRSQMMGGGHYGAGMGGGGRMGSQNQQAGGLVAVDEKGNTITPDPSWELEEGTAAQKLGDMVVKLTLNPYPPSGFSQSSFAVNLEDLNGASIPNAKITLDLTMPAMPMPLNKFDLAAQDAGQYQSNGRFTMRGLWEIEVIIELDGKTQSAFFQVWL